MRAAPGAALPAADVAAVAAAASLDARVGCCAPSAAPASPRAPPKHAGSSASAAGCRRLPAPAPLEGPTSSLAASSPVAGTRPVHMSPPLSPRGPAGCLAPLAATPRRGADAAPPRRSSRVASAALAAARVALDARGAAAAPANLPAPTIWYGPDGPELCPPLLADDEPAPRLAALCAAPAPPLPPAAAAWRADLLTLADAVAAHAVSRAPAAVWRPRHRAPLSPLAARLRPARCAFGDPTNNPADGQHLGAPHALPSWRRLLEAPATATQKDLSAAALDARRARVFTDLSGWARTGMAAVQGGRAALWLTPVPSACGGRGSIPGSAMRVAVRLWLGARRRPDPSRPRCSCGGVADAGGRHFLSFCPAQVARRTAVHHHIVSLVVAALRRAPRWGAVVA